MRLASHNSWSYAQPTKWWMRVFQPFSKCQGTDITFQYAMGVRFFDLRIRMLPEGGVQVCHGLVDYDVHRLDRILDWLDGVGGCSVRVLLDTRHPSDAEGLRFGDWCLIMKHRYENVTFYGGHGAHRPNWNVQYAEIPRQPASVVEKYSSVSGKGVMKLLPRAWARKHNKQMAEQYKDAGYLMLDFVELA